MKNKVFIGWDPREDIAYQVSEYSIISRSPNADVVPLVQEDLRTVGLYSRPVDPLSSTEFTFTRYLIPAIMNYQGWAMFTDCDIIFLEDVQKLFDLADDQYAIMCVKHNYDVKEKVKMDGKEQTVYPRKNWSSVMLINCGHPSNAKLTPELVNDPEITGAYLHRFAWLEDHEIGEFSHEWNWLVGVYQEPKDGKPIGIHHTLGGPWFKNYRNCEYKNVWVKELTNMMKPNFYTMGEGNGVLELFSDGSGGEVIRNDFNFNENLSVPIAFRGIQKRKLIHKCWETNRLFYFMDTGYFANYATESNPKAFKRWHRIVKNNVQHIGEVQDRPSNRWERLQKEFPKLKWPNWKKDGRSILLVTPSDKPCKFYEINAQEWIDTTIETLRQYTDRPIIVRNKPETRIERAQYFTIYDQMDKDDVFALVTYNSIAAVEAVAYGIPAFTLAPNAASSMCSTDLSKVETPYYPDPDLVHKWCCYLAYGQFHVDELGDGTAWKILNKYS